MNFNNFYEAWSYLDKHPIFSDGYGSRFQGDCFSIEVVRVNPRTKEIDEDASKNTETRIWLECGPWFSGDELISVLGFTPDPELREQILSLGGDGSHDIDLDYGASTFEEGVVKLAELVRKKYII